MWNDFIYLIKNDRKMQILLGLFIALVVTVLVVFFVQNVNKTPLDKEGLVSSMTEKEGEGEWKNQINGEIDNSLFEESSISLGETEVTKQYGGVISSYTDHATYGELRVRIGNHDGKEDVFTIRTDSVVFDTQTKTVLTATKLNKVGAKVTLYTTGDIQGEEKKVGVAILNPLSEVMYGEVKKIEYNSSEDVYRITPTTGDRVFYYRNGKYVGNARINEKVTISEVEVGDKLFIYPADKSELVGLEEDDDGRPMIAVQEIHVVKGK